MRTCPSAGFRQQYVVAPDGQSFLIRTLVDDEPPPITLLLNWDPARGARAGLSQR
jgi:hypothetical protein